MHGLDLFSGIGGISSALEKWVRTVAYCESDRYAQGVLLSRMQSGDLDRAPIWDDVRTLRSEMLPTIDIIFGGFPCQDISTAGAGAGLEGERSGLFFEIVRLVRELRPTFIFLENVPAITVRGLDRVLLELTALRYDCRWTIVSAAEVGACHQRDRWFLLAHANSDSIRIESNQLAKCESSAGVRFVSEGEHDPNTKGERLRKAREFRHQQSTKRFASGGEKTSNSAFERLEGLRGSESKLSRPATYNGWKSEPTLRGRDHGISNRVDRIRCLGNSVVPLATETAFKRLCGLI